MSEQVNLYVVGQVVVFTATFTTAAGARADPDTARLRIKRSCGKVDELQLTRESDGVWRAEYDLSGCAGGTYRYRLESTGAVKTAKEGTFEVIGSCIE